MAIWRSQTVVQKREGQAKQEGRAHAENHRAMRALVQKAFT